MSVSGEYSDSLRLCRLTKWPHFDGYGFNLHAEKGKSGQFVGKVDDDSPAQAGGLKEGDRIVRVNGVYIGDENHKQVVERIKAVPNSTELLVVDPRGDAYFKANNISLDDSLIPLVHESGPQPQGINNGEKEIATAKLELSVPVTSQTSHQANNNTLNLNMTAKQLRAQLAAKKKYDPKKDNSLDAKKKFDIIETL